MKKLLFIFLLGMLSSQLSIAATDSNKVNPKFKRDVQTNYYFEIPEANQENCANSTLFSDTLTKIMSESESVKTAQINLERLSEYEQQCELIKQAQRAEQKAQALEKRAKFLKEREERRKQQALAQSQDGVRLLKNRNRDLDL